MQLMENRRQQGKDAILKKLRRNQEFLMTNTLSPSSPVWTKWHQQRANSQEMEKDITNAPNQRYIAVSNYQSRSCKIIQFSNAATGLSQSLESVQFESPRVPPMLTFCLRFRRS